MKTKLIALFIIFTLLISQLPISVMAVSSDYLTVGDVSGEVGDVVTVEVKATKDLTVDDLMVELTYDSDKLSTSSSDITVDQSLKNGEAGVEDGVISMGSYDSNTYTIPAGTTLMIVKFTILSAGENKIETVLDSENSETDTLYSDTVTSNVKGKAPTVAVTGVRLNKEKVTLASGKTETLVATVIPEDATNQNIVWLSSDTSVATVEDGVVTGKKKGTATITAKAEDGNFSKNCEVTVDCSHTNTTTYKAESSTCLTQGHGEYVKCKDCGEIISGSDKKLPLADHDYGKLISEVEPTHSKEELKDGVKAHYKCSVCEKLFIEENGKKKEVTEKDLKIVAEHLYEEEWKTNTENHWKECGCGNIVDLAAHSGGEATCIKKAVCEVCGVEYGDVDSENHEHTEIRDRKEATTREEGYSGDEYCLDCEKLVKKGEVIPVKTPEIKVEPKENSEENIAAANLVKEIMQTLLETEKGEEISNEDAEKLLNAIYDEKQMKVSISTEQIDEKDVEEDAKLIEEKISSDLKIANYYNIEILVEIEGQEEIEKVTKLADKISVSIPIPSDLPEVEDGYERKYSVLTVHNGVADELEAKVEGNSVVVSSDKFSTYVLAYKDVEKPVEETKTDDSQTSENEETKTDDSQTSENEEKTSENSEEASEDENKEVKKESERKTKNTNNPKTGDNILLWIALFVISGLGFAVSVKWNKKRLNGKH